MINQYDVVESLINIPEENLYIGDEGTVVEDFDDNYCMVEFYKKIHQFLKQLTLPPLCIKKI
ncbi:hypothetical protein BSPWISOXPB_7094 [uncultured Gammaproteobacteria bacterium]|nr:hypothetical protein BSPWISOXPB_7094 [uncultured Gammaproteobacteria bacterium]